MNRSLKYFFLYLIALLPIAAGLYYTANYYINEQGIALFYSAAQIAGVHSGLSLVLFAIILAVNSWQPTYTAFAFMGALVVRLILVVIAIGYRCQSISLSRSPVYYYPLICDDCLRSRLYH